MIASFDAEYTLAPASLTIMYSTFLLDSFIQSAIKASDSRDAVPFPIAITSILYLSIKSSTIFLLSSILLCGCVGYITSIFRGLPVESNTANLHPVRNAGSYPSTVFPFIGGVSNRFSTFFEKLSIAVISAVSFNSLLISLSTLGNINLL